MANFRPKEGRLSEFADKAEGVQKPEISANVLYGSPLSLLNLSVSMASAGLICLEIDRAARTDMDIVPAHQQSESLDMRSQSL